MVHGLELGARVLEETTEITAPQETWGQKAGDLASVKGHSEVLPQYHRLVGASALQQGASKIIPQQNTPMGQESPEHGLPASCWSGRGGAPHNNWTLIMNRMASLSRGSM